MTVQRGVLERMANLLHARLVVYIRRSAMSNPMRLETQVSRKTHRNGSFFESQGAPTTLPSRQNLGDVVCDIPICHSFAKNVSYDLMPIASLSKAAQP